MYVCVFVCVSLSAPVYALIRSCSTLGNVAKEAYHSSESKQQQDRDSSHCSRWNEICRSIGNRITLPTSVSVFLLICDCGSQRYLQILMLLSEQLTQAIM